MKRFLMLILCGMLISVCAQAQFTSQNARRIRSGTGAPSGACAVGPPYTDVYIRTSDHSIYECTGASTWTKVVGGGTPGTVTEVSGTANQISVATGTTTPVVSLPSGLIFPGSLTSPAADPADAGAVRLGNTEVIGWEAATPGTDLTLGVNASDVLVSSTPFSAPTVNKVTITAPATSATLTVTNGQTLSYTEGTWIPVRSGFTEVIGAGSFTNTGTYIKIGKQVTVRCLISPAGGATIAATAGAASIQGLPFSGGSMAGSGTFDKADAVTHGGVLVHVTDMFVTTSFSASSSEIVFSATYLVP